MRSDVPLADCCTIGIGGPARHYTTVTSLAELNEALQWAGENHAPFFILGGGSNVLFSDAGFPGLVIHMAMKGISLAEADDANTVLVQAAAGEDWNAFVDTCVGRGLQGVECLAGIPGQVGATPIQNVGAYGQEVSDTITRVQVVDRGGGAPVWIPNGDCAFGYRTSRFKGRDRNRFIVTAVEFALKPDAPPVTSYRDISRYLEQEKITAPTLAQVRDAVMAVRRAKSMVTDPADPNSRSCGSFFTNPIVLPEEAETLRSAAIEAGIITADETMPAHPTGDGRVKLSAAWLIDRSGFKRGQRHGNVSISGKHVLALTNCGGGTAREILALATEIRNRVRDKFGILLDPEPVLPAITLPPT